MGRTKIQWTERSVNPIKARSRETGAVGFFCEHMSAGCVNCYAESMNIRLGTGLAFKPGHRKDVELFWDSKAANEPLRVTAGCMWFVCSMSDLFGDFVLPEWIVEQFAIMAATPHHTYQVLTKRPGRAWQMLNNVYFQKQVLAIAREKYGFRGHDVWPLGNVWMGTSVEDQATADDRAFTLFMTPAECRFLSYEPALALLDLKQIPLPHGIKKLSDVLHQVIVGGESGPRAREFPLGCARQIIYQGATMGIAVFIKQLGRKPSGGLSLKDSKGGEIEEWPEDLRVREFPAQAIR